MKNIVRITESDLIRIVKRVLTESEENLSQEEAFKKPSIKDISKISVSNITQNSFDINFDLTVTNPSGFNIKIKEYDLDIYLDGKNIGKAKMVGETKVLAKKSDTTINVTVICSGNAEKLSNVVISFIKNDTHTVSVKGYIRGGVLMLNKNIAIDVSQSFNKKNVKGSADLIDKFDLGPFNSMKSEIKGTINKATEKVKGFFGGL